MTNKTISLSKTIQISNMQEAEEYKFADLYHAILSELKSECTFRSITNTAEAPASFLAELSKRSILSYLQDIINHFSKQEPIKALDDYPLQIEDVIITLKSLNIQQNTLTLNLRIVSTKLKLIDTIGPFLIIEHPKNNTQVLTFELSHSLLLYSIENIQ